MVVHPLLVVHGRNLDACNLAHACMCFGEISSTEESLWSGASLSCCMKDHHNSFCSLSLANSLRKNRIVLSSPFIRLTCNIKKFHCYWLVFFDMQTNIPYILSDRSSALKPLYTCCSCCDFPPIDENKWMSYECSDEGTHVHNKVGWY